MPEFKRGQGIAYCDSPGPLEKNGKTFFAVEPTPKDWTKQRKESFFREYNNYMVPRPDRARSDAGTLSATGARQRIQRADFGSRHFSERHVHRRLGGL